MSAKKRQKIICLINLILCLAVFLSFMMLKPGSTDENSLAENSKTSVIIWQIDSFEGGKGSRTSYLQSVGNSFSANNNCFVNVKTVSADAARLNMSDGTFPDLISYGAGFYGIENYITGGKLYDNWAHGGYCFLSVDESADFSDISDRNTIINNGTGNLMEVCALILGLHRAEKSKPTAAYVKLINGEFKYLLGTQRDIYRLKSRNIAFKVKPVTEFNDLYQDISIVTKEYEKAEICQRFIDYLISKQADLTKLGLMGDTKIYSDEMSPMEQINYEYKLTTPISEKMKEEIKTAISRSDINLLKNLFK